MSNTLLEAFSLGESADKKSLSFLLNALEKNNLKGFDYIEFIKSVAKLQEMNMDGATAFKSAFATASTLGLTKDKLLSSVQFYVGILNRETEEFDTAVKKQISEKVEKKKSAIAEMKTKIKSYKEKIAAMEKEMHGMQQRIDSGESELGSIMDQITKTQQTFDTTAKMLLDRIAVDQEKINEYL